MNQKKESIKNLKKCNECKKLYDPEESKRIYGPIPSSFECCSAQCYTKLKIDKENPTLKIDRKTDLLLIVDFQNDFISGSLAVLGAEELVPLINEYIKMFRIVILSRDKHKENHPSFIPQGGPWPIHCVENTYGEDIHSGIVWPLNVEVATIFKGMNQEAYSAFERTTLDIIIKSLNTKRIFICGLATDYCVKATTLDAIEKTDTEVFLLTDVIRAVNRDASDGDQAIKEMKDAGAILITLNDLKE